MFYSKDFSACLRFGDIVSGFASVIPRMNSISIMSVSIDVSNNNCVVMSPCCSIEDEVISIAPLVHLEPKFLMNENYIHDFTLINNILSPEDAAGPSVWSMLPLEVKEKKLSAGIGYTYVEKFVYEQNDCFDDYPLKYKKTEITTKYYMIDFRHTFNIRSKEITRANTNLIDHKILELSDTTRESLRQKITKYYAR